MKRTGRHGSKHRGAPAAGREQAAPRRPTDDNPPVPPVPNFIRGLDPALLRADDPEGVAYEVICQTMWPGFIRWAWGSAEVRADFTAATGLVLAAPRSALEAMVDQATGYAASVAERFVEWATVEIYGLEGAPAAYRAEVERRSRGGTAGGIARARRSRRKPVLRQTNMAIVEPPIVGSDRMPRSVPLGGGWSEVTAVTAATAQAVGRRASARGARDDGASTTGVMAVSAADECVVSDVDEPCAGATPAAPADVAFGPRLARRAP